MLAVIHFRVFFPPIICLKIYETVILCIVVCGHETWSHSKEKSHIEGLQEEGSEVTGVKEDIVTREWKKNCIIRDLMFIIFSEFYKLIKSRRMIWVGNALSTERGWW